MCQSYKPFNISLEFGFIQFVLWMPTGMKNVETFICCGPHTSLSLKPIYIIKMVGRNIVIIYSTNMLYTNMFVY